MLEVRSVFKSYDGKKILDDISFHVGAGETICLLGASGSGKSTLLRIIAGLEDSDAGIISFNGRDLSSTPAHLRDFGLVFQDYALFPHLTVYDNVAFGLRMRRITEEEIIRRVASSLEMVSLNGFDKRQVTDLSGGEQQRVALARALSPHPRLLMFDEPLGALDRTLRAELHDELRAILHRTNIPAIYVTHDQDEAFAISDRVLILHEGKIIREGTPADVWANPGSAWVAEFLGVGNVMDGEVIGRTKVAREGRIMRDGRWKVKSDFGVFVISCKHKHQKGEKVHLLARPLTVDFHRVERREPTGERSRDAVNIIKGTVADVVFQQDRYKVTLDSGLYIHLNEAPKIGKRISVRVKVECLA